MMPLMDIRAPDLARITRDLAATEPEARRALNSTLRKMATWIRGRSVKGLSEELQIQQKIIRRRLKQAKLRTTPNGSEVRVWFGLDPVAMIYLKARQNGAGVTASGGRNVRGAFIAKVPQQTGAGASKYQVFKRRGTARLPIDKQVAKIDTKAERHIEGAALWAEFETRFYRVFEHELQWQTTR